MQSSFTTITVIYVKIWFPKVKLHFINSFKTFGLADLIVKTKLYFCLDDTLYFSTKLQIVTFLKICLFLPSFISAAHEQIFAFLVHLYTLYSTYTHEFTDPLLGTPVIRQ